MNQPQQNKDLAALRVVVLTRTGRLSGLSFAKAIDESGHTLCGILAERRSTLIWSAWRKMSPAACLRKYGAVLILSRLWEGLVSVVRSLPRQIAAKMSRRHGHVTSLGALLPVQVVGSLNSDETLCSLRALAPDVLVVANAPILEHTVFDSSRFGAINFHSGRLPEYGGVESEFWTLYNGEDELWVTIHQVADRLDSGTILAEAPLRIRQSDTPQSLHQRAVMAAQSLVVSVLDAMATGTLANVRDPGRAILRPWPTSRQRLELRRRRTCGVPHRTHR